MKQLQSIRLLKLMAGTVLLGTLFTGCSTMKVTPLTTGSADSYTQHEQQNGVVVGIRPMTDKGEIKDIFKVNLLNKGLLPILVVVENKSAAASFIVAKEKIAVLCDATGASSTSQRKAVKSGTAGTVVGITGAVLLGAGSVAGAPFAIVGMKMASNATVVQHNLADKEFYSRTLGPGEKAQGFVYFQYPKESPPAGNYHIMVELKNSATGEAVAFDFPANLTLP